jgi:hypothetical protein
MSCDQRSSPDISTGLRLVTLCKQEFRVASYGNQFTENDLLYQEKSILIMYIDCANVSRSMWVKSVLQFASYHSQIHVFRATDQYRFRARISSVFCRLVFVYKK